MGTLHVFYDKKQGAPNARAFSPSAAKPEKVVRSWKKLGLPLKVVGDFAPASLRDFALAHDLKMVTDILARRAPNGFYNKDAQVAASLPWTTGSMVAATLHALKHGGIAASPTSGFHHAGYDRPAAFCTFNGLMVAAFRARLMGATRVGILDFDQHYGNGTDDIIRTFDVDWVEHLTLCDTGVYADREGVKQVGFRGRTGRRIVCSAREFLVGLPALLQARFANCDVVLYQAGADSCVDDPLGGRFTVAQMRERDRLVFRTLLGLGVPVAFNLAGGYQRDLRKVLDLHDATAQEAVQALRVHAWDAGKRARLA